MIQLERAWINQPSRLQRFHRWHGMLVLAGDEGTGARRVYFLSGSVVSMVMPADVLSPGWPDHLRENADRQAADRLAKGVSHA